MFPVTTLQTCVVHPIRNSLDLACWKDRKALAAAIKPIYTAPSAEADVAELDAFEEKLTSTAALPDRRRGLAAVLEPCDSVLRVPARDAADDLNHQRRRERAFAAAQDHQEPQAFPERRGRHQADLASPSQHRRRLESGEQRVEIGDEPVRDTVRAPLHPRAALSGTKADKENRLTHKKFRQPD